MISARGFLLLSCGLLLAAAVLLMPKLWQFDVAPDAAPVTSQPTAPEGETLTSTLLETQATASAPTETNSRVELAPPNQTTGVAPPKPGIAVTGQLLFENSAPGKDLKLRLYTNKFESNAAGQDVMWMIQAQSGKGGRAIPTDAEGRFQFELKEGHQALLIPYDESFVLAAAKGRIEVPPIAKPFDAGRVTIVPPARLRVTVLHQGLPLAGVEVEVEKEGNEFNFLGRIFNQGATKPITNEQGVYERGGMAAGAYQLTCNAPEYKVYKSNLSLRAGETKDLRAELERGAHLSGRVVDDLGAAVARYELSVDEKTVVTDAQGAFRFEGLTEKRVKLRGEGSKHADREFEVELGDNVTLTAPRCGTIEGRVVDTAGAAIKRGFVRATSARYNTQTAKTSTGGRFKITKVSPGPVTLTASTGEHLDSPELKVDLPPGGALKDLVLTVAIGAEIEVSVVHADGRPVVAAEVSGKYLDEQRSYFKSEKTNAKGIARLTGLVPGRVQIYATLRGKAQSQLQDLVVTQGAKISATLQMYRGGTAEVTVLDAAGQPMSMARVLVSGPAGASSKQLRGVTDASGKTSLTGLAPGKYFADLPDPEEADELGLISAFRTGKSDRTEFAIADEAVVPVTLRAALQARVTGIVSDANGPLAGVEVQISRKSNDFEWYSRPVKQTTDAQGSFQIDRLASGTVYVIRLQAPESGTRFIFTRELLAGVAADSWNLQVPNAKLTVAVTDDQGKALAGAQISISHGGHKPGEDYLQSNARTEVAASTTLTRLAAARLRVHVSHPDFISENSDADLSAGAASIHVTMKQRGGRVLCWVDTEDAEFGLRLMNEQGKQTNSSVLRRGKVEFNSLRPGRYRIALAEHAPGRMEPVEVLVEVGKTTQVQLPWVK